MARGLRLARGVIWYPLGQDLWIVVSPLGLRQEKCRVVKPSDAATLDFFKNNSPVDIEEIPQTARETVENWLSAEFPILEESKDSRPLDEHEHLALSIYQEYKSAKNLECCHDLIAYHKHGIQDSRAQFDRVETTVSHLYREAHPALENRSYGGRFAEILLQEGAIRGGAAWLEVGGGTGLFARDFLAEVKRSAPSLYDGLHYTFFDLSPVLMASQREINKEHGGVVSFVQGDVGSHDFPEEAYDLVISNEMIADLDVIKLKREKKSRKGPQREAWDLTERLRLDLSDAPPQFILSVGALRFLLKLSRALKPGGKAYIVEYGSPHAYPIEQVITDHREYSIHFGHLLSAARALDLKGSLRVLTEFLRFDPGLEVLDSLSHAALFNHLIPFLGIKAEAQRVYTRSMLVNALSSLVLQVRNLVYVPLPFLKGIAYPDGFHVLKLMKGRP